MNQYWMFLVFILSMTPPVFGASTTESVSGRPVRLGFEAGMTFSSLDAPSDISVSNRVGLAAGVNVEIPLASFLSTQIEALYVQRGADLLNAGNIKFSARADSLEFPVLLKAKLNQDVSPFLFAGPVAILNLRRSVSAVGSDGGASLGYNPRTFDFSLALGGGVDLGPVFVSIRYNYDLTDQGSDSVELKSRGIHLLAGVRL